MLYDHIWKTFPNHQNIKIFGKVKMAGTKNFKMECIVPHFKGV